MSKRKKNINWEDHIGYPTNEKCPKCNKYTIIRNKIGDKWCSNCNYTNICGMTKEQKKVFGGGCIK